MGLLVRTAWTLGLLTTAVFSMLLIGCYHGEVLNPSERQGLELFCLFIYFLAQSEGLSLPVYFFSQGSLFPACLIPSSPV